MRLVGVMVVVGVAGDVKNNGLARDLRPDEALSLAYTSEPLIEPLDIYGLPEERFADLYRAARISALHLQDDARAASLLEKVADVAAKFVPGKPAAS